jgi:RHS repeat-associated protein
MVGVGWSLTGATSQITRCPRTHAVDGEAYPVTLAATKDSSGNWTYIDRFCLDGDYLVSPDNPTISKDGLTEYRPEHSPSVRVTMKVDKGTVSGVNGPLSFLVEYPDGRKSTYDTVLVAEQASVQANHTNFDPTKHGVWQSRNQSWLLSKVSDPAGNTMTISYSGAPGECNYTVPCEVVPDTIAYTSFVTNGKTTTPALRKVVFGYTSTRTDTSNAWVSGVQLATTKLLNTITVSGPNSTVASTLWTYTLSYTNDSVSGRSLLHSVQQCDAGGTCKPATTFDWEEGASTFSQYVIGYGQHQLGAIKIADFNGDGLPDLITTYDNSKSLVVLLASRSQSQFGNGVTYTSIGTTGISGDLVGDDSLADATPIDIDSDGAAELAVRQKENGKQWLRFYRFNGTKFDQMPDDGNEVPDNIDPYIYVADLDGDGLPELIRAVSGNWSYRKNSAGVLGPYALLGGPKVGGGTNPIAAIREYNNYVGDLDGSGRSTILLMTSPADTDTRYGGLNLTTTQRSANGVSLSATTVPWVARYACDGLGKVLLDLNGDGLADALEFPASGSGGLATYFTNTGRGMLGGYPIFAPPLKAEERIYSDCQGNDVFIVMDVNQDGRDDIVSAPYNTLEHTADGLPLNVFLSNGVGLSEPTTISYNIQYPSGGTITWGASTTASRFHSLDANGDGLADFIMADSNDGKVYVYLHDGKKADMITSFNNGGGSSVRVTYSPWERAEPYSKTSDCKYPVRCPARGLWVVSDYHLDLNDHAESHPMYRYTYDQPAMDMLGRGWLGFGERTVTDVNSGQVTSYLTSNLYRRGSSYPDAGRPGTVEKKVLLENGILLTGTTTTGYDLISGNIDTPGHAFAIGAKSASYVESETSTSGEVTNFRNLQTTIDYDSYGNVWTTERLLGDGSFDRSLVTHLNDTTNWILSPPTYMELHSLSASTGIEGSGGVPERLVTYDYSPTLPRSLTKVTIEPTSFGSNHLEVGITSWNQFGLPQTLDAVDLKGEHRITEIQYDDQEGSQPTVITNPAKHVFRTIYDKGSNLPIWRMEPNALVTSIYHYPFGRLQAVVPPDNNVLTMSYTSPASSDGVLKITRKRSSGEVKSTVFDSLDRPTSTEWLAMNGKTARTETSYDSVFLDKPSSLSVPQFTDDPGDIKKTWIYYDNAGRPLEVLAPDGRFAQVAYSGLKSTITDPKGNQSYSIEDDLRRITKHVSIMPASDVGGAREIATTYVWGAFSQLEKIVDANGHAVQASYDTVGRVSSTTDPDRGSKTLTFNAFGDLISVLDAVGTTTFTPDALGRTTNVVSPDGTATYTWDTATNGIGQLATSTSADGVDKTLTYDSLSRVSSTTWKIDGESYALGQTYDPLGRLETISYPEVSPWSRFKSKYNYAANGDPLSLTDVPSGTDAARLFWKADERDPMGRIKTEEFGNGAQTTTYGIDQVRGVVTGITTTIGTSVLQSLGYDYDENLNVKTRTDAVAGVAEQFGYDALDRLHTWQEVGSFGWGVTYSHDDIGNLTGRSLLGSQGETESLTFEHSGVNAGPHAVTSSPWGAYGYDGKGNQTSSPEGTIAYTSFNLPKNIVGTDTTTFAYDASGARVLKKSAGNTLSTVYAGGLYERRTVANSNTHVFYLNVAGRQIGQILRKESDQSETVLYIHSDALGSSEVVTDAGGQLVGQRRKYDPFGAPTDITLPKAFPSGVLVSSDVHLGFTGHEEDSETGLINMRGRIYNPRVGHFLTPDPFTNNPFSPVAFNPYAYVLNNPLKYTDPSGFDTETEFPGGSKVTFDDPLEVHVDLGGAGCGGGTELPTVYDYGSSGGQMWLPGDSQNVYPIKWLGDSKGTKVMLLPGGGWMRSDEVGTVHFQTRDGSRGTMDLYTYLDNAVYDGDGLSGVHNEKVRNFRGEISDNPSLQAIANTTSSPSPRAVGGQSAASSGINRGSRTVGNLTPFSLDVNPTNGAAAKLFEMAVKIAGPTTPQEFAVSAILPVVGKYLVEIKVGGQTLLKGWKLGAFKSATKWANQMEKRGWTPEQISKAISEGESFAAENLVNKGNTATRYVHPETGRSVIIDDVTEEVIHVGGENFKY